MVQEILVFLSCVRFISGHVVRKRSMFFQSLHKNLRDLPLPERFIVRIFS